MKDTQKAFKYTYEFNYTFKINGEEQVSRDFNVKDYNDKFRESLESQGLMTEIMGDGTNFFGGYLGIIPTILKDKTAQRLWRAYEINKLNSPEFKQETATLSFEIKKRVGNSKETILITEYETNAYPSAVLEYVDMRDQLPRIMETIKETMSQNNFTTTYCGAKLKRYNKISKKDLNYIMNERK